MTILNKSPLILPFFSLIIVENGVLYIVSDRIITRESAKNGQICAHGFNFKILFNSELIFKIYDENFPTKKIFISLRQF